MAYFVHYSSITGHLAIRAMVPLLLTTYNFQGNCVNFTYAK